MPRLLTFRTFLQEADQYFPPARPTMAHTEYYAVTPKGSRSLFNRVVPLMQVRNAMSETAIQLHLKTLHRGCEIIIQSLSFR